MHPSAPIALVAAVSAALCAESSAAESPAAPSSRPSAPASPARNASAPSDSGEVSTLNPHSVVTTNSLEEAQGNPLQTKKGARTEPEPPKEEKPREWFGTTPWWEWSRFTGDWGGGRQQLEDLGFAVGGNYTFDGASVVAGGVRQRSVARGMLKLNMTYDPNPLLGIEGGQLFAEYMFRHGRNGDLDVGDLQGYSNLDNERLSRANEVWYEQKLFGDKLRLKLGQVDANAEFDFVEAAADFINPSAGFGPSIIGFPTYPDPALSANLFWYPCSSFYCGVGAFADNFKNLSKESFTHPFLIAEAGGRHEGRGALGPGRLAAGVWHNTDDQTAFTGKVASGTTGWYLLGEQQVWRENPDGKDDTQGLTLWGQYGWGDGRFTPFAQYAGLGVTLLGWIPTRDADSTGLHWHWVGTSRATAAGFDANESALEFYHLIQVTGSFSLKPGVEWIQNPGGSAAADDAVVLTLRAGVEF